MTVSYIALGSNLGNPVEHIASAFQALGHTPKSQLLAQSPWYRSTAIKGGGVRPLSSMPDSVLTWVTHVSW